ncbi:MAG: tetratricopeptide repeat protein, partial [Victivallaceae bacterium]
MQLEKQKKICCACKSIFGVKYVAPLLAMLLAPGVLAAAETNLPPATAPIAATPHARFIPEIFFSKESEATVPNDLDLGREAMKSGNYSGAIDFFNRARHNLINTAAEQQSATLLLANAYLKANQLAEAQRCLQEYNAGNPATDKDFGQLLQGEIYQAQGKYPEAIKLFDGIIQQSPVGQEIYCRALNGRGMVKAEMKKYPEAMTDFQLLLKTVSGSEWELTALTNAIKAALKTRQLTESAALLEQAQKFKNDPRYNEISKLNLLQLFYEGKYADFTTNFKQEVEKNRDESSDPTLFGIALEAAKYYIANRAPGSAIPYLKGAIRCAANETERRQTMQTLIECYDHSNQLPEAINLLGKMLELYPTHPDNELAAKYLAELYERNQQLELAAASCVQTLRNPAFSKAIRHWAGRTAAKLYRQLASNDRAAEQLYYLYENLPAEENRNAEMFLLGEHFYLSGNFERALDLLKPLAHPGNKLHGAAQFLIIQIYLTQHDGTNALKYTQNLNQIANLEFREKCAFLRGEALFENRQYRAATQTFADFTKNYPSSSQRPNALLNAGKCAFVSGDYPASKQYLSSFIKEYPQSADIAEAKYFMVKNYFMENNSAEMAATLKEMSEKYPDNPA